MRLSLVSSNCRGPAVLLRSIAGVDRGESWIAERLSFSVRRCSSALNTATAKRVEKPGAAGSAARRRRKGCAAISIWSHAARANRRLKAFTLVSLTLIVRACETHLIQNTRSEAVTDMFRELFAEPAETVAGRASTALNCMRRVVVVDRRSTLTASRIHTQVGAATRFTCS